MKRVALVALCLGCIIAPTTAWTQVDYSRHAPPEVFIFPTPRQAAYGALDLDITGPGGPAATIILPASPSPLLLAAADDFNATLARIAPQAKPLPVVSGGKLPKRPPAVCILLGVAGHHPALDQALAKQKLRITPTDPGAQGYRIAVARAGSRPLVLLAGCDEQGAYWAAGSLAQLLRTGRDGRVRAYSASVRDWPGYAVRMCSFEPVYESKGHEQARCAEVLGMKLNTSCYGGDNLKLNGWLRQRGFRAGTGYWVMQNIGRKTNELGLEPFEWSDARINQAWADAYAANAATKPGLVAWHDCTDAGWFNKYIEKFWNHRSEADREAYPDATPARADAARINAMYQAIKAVSPDTDLYATVPCYYDQPQDDKLPGVEAFRSYLRTLGSLTPKDVVWILEDRGPDDIAAYERYLGRRCVNYRYPLASGVGLWSTNFTAAKHAVASTDAYWFCVGHYPHDLLLAAGAEYMWNPDLPEDYAYITEQCVPRACKYLFGGAWREMADFYINQNVAVDTLQTGVQPEVARAGQQKVGQAIATLNVALGKCENSLPEGQVCIRELLAQVQGAQQWLGLRVAISEAQTREQKAEQLLAFEQPDKARQSLEEARGFLAQVSADQLAQFSFLRPDFDTVTAAITRIQQLAAQPFGTASLSVLPLDGQWLFKLDPRDEGVSGSWFAVEDKRADWLQIGVPGLWEDSGVAGAQTYDGFAWYARSFELPPGWNGKRVELHVGAVDDEAWVYVNGQPVGSHLVADDPQNAWQAPFAFDITDKLLWDRPNLIVVRVNDTKGGGGIWKSVYLQAAESGRVEGPGLVEIQPAPPAAPLTPPQTPPATPSAPEVRSSVQPGWSVTLTSPAATNPVELTVGLLDYGGDPANTAGRALTDQEKAYLAQNRVGRLAVTSFTVGGVQTVMQSRYPGHLRVFTLSWDGYAWNYHCVDEAAVTRNAQRQSVLLKGRLFCANYGRIGTFMQYEYEIGLCADGLGYERLTLIPDHDTGFSPLRNGPAYGSSSVNPGVSDVMLALGPLPAAFTGGFAAPFADVPPRLLPLDFAKSQSAFDGPLEPLGLLGAYDPADGIYLALIAPPGHSTSLGQMNTVDEATFPGAHLQLRLSQPVTSNWTAASRNQFERWFTAGRAASAETAAAGVVQARGALAIRPQ